MLPNVVETIKEGGLGLGRPNTDGVFAIVATAAQGTDNVPKAFSSVNDILDEFGAITVTGKVPDNPLAAYGELAIQNGAQKVWLVKATDATPTNILAAIDTLVANEEIRGVYCPEPQAETFVASLQTKADAWLTGHRPSFFTMEAKDVAAEPDTATYITTLTGAYTGAAKYVGVSAGFVDFVNGRGEVWTGRAGGAMMGILGKSKVSRNPGYVRYNQIVNAVAIAPPDPTFEAYTEAQLDTLNTAKFITARTITGITGFYITDAPTLAAAGSDYAKLETVRTVFKAIREVRAAMLPNLNADFPASGDDLLSALAELEAQGEVPLNRMIAAQEITAMDRMVVIDPGQDFLGTSQINVDVSITPRFVSRVINLRFALKNPAL